MQPPDALSPFAEKLSALLKDRGAASKLSAQSGVPTSHISKMCDGKVLPSPDTLERLIEPLAAEDRCSLVVEYLLLHRPKNAKAVRVLISADNAPQDLLDREIQFLDTETRNSLASLVAAVNRSPSAGSQAIRSIGSWFSESRSQPAQDEQKLIIREQNNLPDKQTAVAESAENSECQPPTSAQAVDSTATAPTSPSPQAPANVVRLPTAHWRSETGSSLSSQVAEDPLPSDTSSQSAPTPDPEPVRYTKRKRRRP